MTRVSGGSQGRHREESPLTRRRLHGLQPEIVDTETIGENPLTATELEEPKVRVVREFKESYDTADLTGITFPIHVDGTYHG